MDTGLRIDTAADDPAGFGIAERLRAQVRSLEQGRRNANDAIDLLQTAEGALQTAAELTPRLQELSVAGRNGTLAADDRAQLAKEFDALVDEINRIGLGTRHGDQALFTGGNLQFQIGAGTSGDDTVAVQFGTLHVTFDFATVLQATAGNGGVGHGTAPANPSGDEGATPDDAERSDPVRELGDAIAAQRAQLGATESRLRHVLSQLDEAVTHGTESRSRLVDADLAAIAAAATRNRMLVDAGTAILAQANSAPGIALRRLG